MKKILFFIILVSSSIFTYAQNYYGTEKAVTVGSAIGFDKSKLTFGGGFGMQFGNYTLISFAPQVGYNFSRLFNAGMGLSYTFYKDDFYVDAAKWDEKRHYFGLNAYGRLYPVEYLVVSVQPEITRMWRTLEPKSSQGKISENKFVPSVVVGAGVRLGPITAMLQYDLVQNDYSPYGDRIFYSVGYVWSF